MAISFLESKERRSQKEQEALAIYREHLNELNQQIDEIRASAIPSRAGFEPPLEDTKPQKRGKKSKTT